MGWGGLTGILVAEGACGLQWHSEENATQETVILQRLVEEDFAL